MRRNRSYDTNQLSPVALLVGAESGAYHST